MEDFISLLNDNKEWLFSGLGLFILIWLGNFIRTKINNESGRPTANELTENLKYRKANVQAGPVSISTRGNISAHAESNGVAIAAEGDVYISLSDKDFEKSLRTRRNEIYAELDSLSSKNEDEIRILVSELDVAHRELANLHSAYKAQKEKLSQAIRSLSRYRDKFSYDQLQKAKSSLAAGETKEAEWLFTKVLSGGKASAAEAAFQLSVLAKIRLDYFSAHKYLNQATELEPGNVHYLLAAGELMEVLGYYSQAEKKIKNALSILEEQPSKDNKQIAKTLKALGNIAFDQGRYSEAESLLKRSLETQDKCGNVENNIKYETLIDYALVIGVSDRIKEAEELIKQALKDAEAMYGKEHHETGLILTRYAEICGGMAQWDKVDRLLQRALQIFKNTIGEDHPDVAIALNDLGVAYATAERYEEAERAYRRALQIREAKLGKAHPHYALSLNNFSFVLRKQGKFDEAEKGFRRALEIQRSVLGKSHPDYAQSLNNLAGLYRDQERYEEALTLYRESLAIYETSLGSTHVLTERVRRNLKMLTDELDMLAIMKAMDLKYEK